MRACLTRQQLLCSTQHALGLLLRLPKPASCQQLDTAVPHVFPCG